MFPTIIKYLTTDIWEQWNWFMNKENSSFAILHTAGQDEGLLDVSLSPGAKNWLLQTEFR